LNMAKGEMVEKELDAMIERGSRKGEVDPDERGAMEGERQSPQQPQTRRDEGGVVFITRTRQRITEPFWRPS
jgi:hypothetical protein